MSSPSDPKPEFHVEAKVGAVTTETEQQEGLVERYTVTRADGRDGPGDKHHACRYFVLDLTHDPRARATLWAYASGLPDEQSVLREDLFRLVFDTLKPPEKLKNDCIREPGEDCHCYWVDSRPYVLMDMDDWSHGVNVIDLDRSLWYRLNWEERSKDGSVYIPACTCAELLWDDDLRVIDQECPHWRAWDMYYREYLWEPDAL